MDFEKIYHAYFMEVYSYVMTIIKDPHEAEEITQEAFFRAMRAKHPYKGKSAEKTWLCAIAKNICMDVLRRRKRGGVFSVMDPQGGSSASEGEDPEQKVIRDMAEIEIHQVLHNMEEPYREVFHLRVFGELSFAQIGLIFAKTENWARVTYHRARLKLQERLGEKNE